ncbi:tetratricopeptide repeat protein [Limobrevibacterium gyesilva]|uniref:Tetratricopeptide repeat protein n=1 Tax=Limobrevibacterium gyesilva TaxID=2991712 RepID=A0AA41YH75_9PROT|nr:tetratricopeptide repeat protein [Limobrevibacterium gyesilva]
MSFVGTQTCAGCHQAEAERWEGSHHALAMQRATEATVLGDFSGAGLEHFGVATTFSRAGATFMVRTDGPDGALHDYEIAYTFGVYPLQQYLIAMPGGRLQALGIAWDSRPKDQGGERWFHLYPDQKLPAGGPLHWSGRDQTWNYMCADCHSTGVRKNYDLGTNTYATTWSDVDVSCESCHGPGSRHVAWARDHPGAGPYAARTDASGPGAQDRMGIVAWLKATDHGRWEMQPETGIARRTEPLVSAELDACAGCHSRRKTVATNAPAGAPFLDSYLPALLEPGLYHADGQIDGEVYEYGSFVQSRMHFAGVTCSNCHDPHSLKLRAEGNSLCAQCHMPAKFDVPAHHHHQPGGTGAQCVNCHMPTKTYMVIDTRRDHSFRVPRPDLSVSIGTPNACTQCHAGRPPEWAAQVAAGWFPHGRQTTAHYGTALDAGRTGARDAEQQLDRLILDQSQPAIARASALLLLPRYTSPASEPAVLKGIADPNPLVRLAAPRALSAAASAVTVQAAMSLLSDPVRAVRIEAARALAGVDPRTTSPGQRNAFNAAYQELIAAEMIDADRPEAHLNLGLLNTRRGQLGDAEAEYRTALRLAPDFVPALANLADLDRMRGMDQQGAELLRKALAIDPNNADVRHSLGLLLVRQHNYTEALGLLRQASELAPDNARYAYVYAIALNSSGEPRQAIALLERTHRQHPTDRDVLAALVSIARAQGDFATALLHARELLTLSPADPQLRILVLDLQRRQTR